MAFCSWKAMGRGPYWGITHLKRPFCSKCRLGNLKGFLYAYNMPMEYEGNFKEAFYVYLVESSLHRMKQPTSMWRCIPSLVNVSKKLFSFNQHSRLIHTRASNLATSKKFPSLIYMFPRKTIKLMTKL